MSNPRKKVTGKPDQFITQDSTTRDTKVSLISPNTARNNITMRRCVTNIPTDNSFDCLTEEGSDDNDNDLASITSTPSRQLNRSIPAASTNVIEDLDDMKNKLHTLQEKLLSAESEIENLLLENSIQAKQICEYKLKIDQLTHICKQTSTRKSSNQQRRSLTRSKLDFSDTKKEQKSEQNSSKNSLQVTPSLGKSKKLHDQSLHSMDCATNNTFCPNYTQTDCTIVVAEQKKHSDSTLAPHDIKEECRKPKLCILTNSVCGTIQSVEDTFNQFDYIRYVSSNCNIQSLLLNIDYKLRNYSIIDYCIIILGEQDFKTPCIDYAALIKTIREAVQHISHTNIIICTPTYVCGAPIYNYKIELFNTVLYLELQNNTYAYFYDSNRNVSLDMFSSKTGMLTNLGLRHMYKDILCNIIADYSHYGYSMHISQTTKLKDEGPKLFLA